MLYKQNNEALACFLNNVTSEDLANVIYDGSRLKWCNDLTSLKTFVAEVLCQSAKWCSPGGYSKKFISSNAELTLTWHQGKQNTLLFQGKDGNLVRDKFVSLCRAQSCTSKPSHGQEQALPIDSGTSMPSKDAVSKSVQVCQDSLQNYSINYLSNCRCSCGVLAADVEGVKLDITILQSRIELLSESKMNSLIKKKIRK